MTPDGRAPFCFACACALTVIMAFLEEVYVLFNVRSGLPLPSRRRQPSFARELDTSLFSLERREKGGGVKEIRTHRLGVDCLSKPRAICCTTTAASSVGGKPKDGAKCRDWLAAFTLVLFCLPCRPQACLSVCVYVREREVGFGESESSVLVLSSVFFVLLEYFCLMFGSEIYVAATSYHIRAPWAERETGQGRRAP